MEEENEQLDYDEDVLEAAQKKAKELRQEVELVVSQQSSIQPSSLPLANSDQLSAPGTNPIETITTNSAAPRPNFRYYVNPNFNKPRYHHSNISNLPSSYGQVQTNRIRYATHPHQQQTTPFYQNPNQQQVFVHQPRHLFHVNQMATAFPAPHQVHAQTSHPQILGHPTVPPPIPTTSGGGGNVYINRNAMTANNNNWDMMVDEFVRKNISARRRHRYSRSRSSSSSSRSTSANSSTSRSQSASRSPSSGNKSPKRLKDDRRKYPAKRATTSKSTAQNSNNRMRHGHQPKSNNPQVKITHQTIECARAIGLDDDYLKKVEEQNRLREEIARRKSQHRRQETTDTKSGTNLDDEMASAPNRKRPKIQGPFGETEGKQRNGGREEKTGNNKLKPYLAVVVTNLRGVGQAEKKVNQLAGTIGPIKKIWRDGADDCHVIFERHEDAKQFMLQFHGKGDVLPSSEKEKATAPCIDVTLKKVFLNLTDGSGGGSNEE